MDKEELKKKIGHGYEVGNFCIKFLIHKVQIMEFERVRKLKYKAAKDVIMFLIYVIISLIIHGIIASAENVMVVH